MQRTMLQSKIHYATVTRAELCDESSYSVDGVFPCAGESPALHDNGSCAIDEALLEVADIRQYQQVEIYDVDKGERFTTCAMRAKRGSGIISLSGAAAQHAAVGDVLIIATYGSYSDVELERYKPRLIYVDERNRVDDRCTKIPVRLG